MKNSKSYSKSYYYFLNLKRKSEDVKLVRKNSIRNPKKKVTRR